MPRKLNTIARVFSLTFTLVFVALGLVVGASPSVAADSASDALKAGKATIMLRYRYEGVDQEGLAEEASASTVLGRLGYTSGAFNGFSLSVEVDTIQAIGNEQFNSGGGTSGANRARFPVVADPEGTEVNEAYIQYAGFDNTQVKLGRVGVNFDNQRFVGGVAWRQNEQTYDGLLISHSTTKKTKVAYLYIDNVNRIFGEDVAGGDHESSSHMLNINRHFEGFGSLSGYAYLIDNKDAPAFSTNTVGLRWVGGTTVGGRAMDYIVEFASQRDGSNNPVDFDANYLHAEATLDLAPVKLFAGFEILGGDQSLAGSAFRTPLATLHKFNGWADVFLATPGDGLEDLYLGIKGTVKGINWSIQEHEFSAEDGSADFGSEWNLIATTKLWQRYDLMLKFADFSADSPRFADVKKFWLMATAKF